MSRFWLAAIVFVIGFEFGLYMETRWRQSERRFPPFLTPEEVDNRRKPSWKFFAPAITPEILYFLDRDQREWDEEEKKFIQALKA